MCNDYSYFRRRQLLKSATMTETAVLLPIEMCVKYDLSEYLAVIWQPCFQYLRKSLLLSIKCINYNSPGVGV